MHTIRIINLRVHANHGVYEFEKVSGQIFEIDVEIYADLDVAMVSDNLDDTINYEKIVESITKIFTKKKYNLIETVGGKVCDHLIKEYPLEKVILKIRKPDAPINADFDAIEFEFERKK
tara:strand:+ start:203 stop:559 length:357 start_codon:yes stop_codon:yes gene_type:complete